MDIDVDALVREIDKRIAEIELEESLDQGNDLISRVNVIKERFEGDIDEIYEKYMKELNQLIGLDEVKVEIRKLISYLLFVIKVGDRANFGKMNLNMIFRGNPGTGKTTVARIVGRILCDLGFLRSNKFIETTPRDFIAGYIGQTALKAKDTIERARGGVIFIDEAYTFAERSDNSFAPEAITEIIKEMETGDTVFIFSGYGKEMDDFVALNAGIKSRIYRDIYFKDYSRDELFLMFSNKLKNSGLQLEDGCRDFILSIIDDRSKKKNFGNGRMIDNLFSEILREHALLNVSNMDRDSLLLINQESIQNIESTKNEGGIGFE